MKSTKYIVALLLFSGCSQPAQKEESEIKAETTTARTKQAEINLPPVYISILGNVQDGGCPHAGCQKECCVPFTDHPDSSLMVVSLGLTDREYQQNWIFEATPDLSRQIAILTNKSQFADHSHIDGVFLTHAHIGHYTGLMYFGKEASNTENIPVYAMPRMKKFLESNGPWSQLVEQKNIIVREIYDDSTVVLNDHIAVTPLTVPHRDEFSETVGYIIAGPNKTVESQAIGDDVYDIVELIQKVDYAFIDGTFYGPDELKNRDMSEIPHPFIVESMELFEKMPAAEKQKVWFIHLNHSNPALKPGSPESQEIQSKGFNVARFGDIFEL